MNILYTAYDTDGVMLHSEVIPAESWREACARGMVYRNALVTTGIRVTWVKA